MEAHRPEPEEHWQNRQFDEQHRQESETMTPKEKATQIKNKIGKAVEAYSWTNNVIKSSIVLVDELIGECYEMGLSGRHKFWTDVKIELEKI